MIDLAMSFQRTDPQPTGRRQNAKGLVTEAQPPRAFSRNIAGCLLSALLLAQSALTPSAFAQVPVQDLPELSNLPTIEPVEPLRLNTKVTRFLVNHVKPNLDREARMQSLIDAIFDPKALGIRYGNERTKTAIETFETRNGNCLSFTVLFVAMARHVGLRAYFQDVAEVTSWDRRGELVVTHQHMFAEVELDNGIVQVDFLPGTHKRYRKIHRIKDQRALAHFYNNLGVEYMLFGGDTLLVLPGDAPTPVLQAWRALARKWQAAL